MHLAKIYKYLSLFIEGSILDYPRKGLDKDLWIGEGKDIKLKDKIADEALDVVYSMLDDLELPDSALKDFFIYGSILTNRYTKTTDVDARIVLDPTVVYKRFGKDITGDMIFDLTVSQIHDILLGDTQHPLNCTVIIEGEETELGQAELGKTEEDPLYDVLNEKMLVPPYIYEDADPDEDFKQERDEVANIMDKLDKLIQETRADTIDYTIIEDAVGEVREPDKLIGKMEKKLEEIEDNIALLVEEYRKIKEERIEAYEGDEPGHAEKGNIKAKYLERYKYLDILRKLKRLFKEGIEPEEIDDVEEAIGIR